MRKLEEKKDPGHSFSFYLFIFSLIYSVSVLSRSGCSLVLIMSWSRSVGAVFTTTLSYTYFTQNDGRQPWTETTLVTWQDEWVEGRIYSGTWWAFFFFLSLQTSISLEMAPSQRDYDQDESDRRQTPAPHSVVIQVVRQLSAALGWNLTDVWL